MTPLVFAVTLICFVGALLASSALLWGARTRKRADRLELQRRVGPIPLEGGVLRTVEAPRAKGLLGVPAAWLSLQLRNAGDPRTAGRLAVAMLLFAVAGGLVTGLLLTGPGQASGLLMGTVPVLVLRSRARKRHDQIIEQLPEALDLVARSLRAGHALTDAFRTAAGEIRAPLGPELVTMTEQHRIGQPLRVCLDQLMERNPMVFDLRLLGSAVMLQRETGANLIEILEHLAGTLRERQVFTHKLAALTAEVRVSASILGALPFVVAGVLLLLRPGYLKPLVTAPLGQGLLWTGLALMGSGLLLMRSLSRVEV